MNTPSPNKDIQLCDPVVMPYRTSYIPVSADTGREAIRQIHWEQRIDTDNQIVATHRFDHDGINQEEKLYLVFSGVDQEIQVLLNDSCLGSDPFSCGLLEFDISKQIRTGENVLTVVYPRETSAQSGEDVLKCAYLLRRPADHLWDYSVKTQVSGSGTVHVCLSFAGAPSPVSMTLKTKAGDLVAQTSSDPVDNTDHLHHGVLRVQDPILWDLEHAYSYILELECRGERIQGTVAFKKISIHGDQIYLNDEPIRICGTDDNQLLLKNA